MKQVAYPLKSIIFKEQNQKKLHRISRQLSFSHPVINTLVSLIILSLLVLFAGAILYASQLAKVPTTIIWLCAISSFLLLIIVIISLVIQTTWISQISAVRTNLNDYPGQLTDEITAFMTDYFSPERLQGTKLFVSLNKNYQPPHFDKSNAIWININTTDQVLVTATYSQFAQQIYGSELTEPITFRFNHLSQWFLVPQTETLAAKFHDFCYQNQLSVTHHNYLAQPVPSVLYQTKNDAELKTFKN